MRPRRPLLLGCAFLALGACGTEPGVLNLIIQTPDDPEGHLEAAQAHWEDREVWSLDPESPGGEECPTATGLLASAWLEHEDGRKVSPSPETVALGGDESFAFDELATSSEQRIHVTVRNVSCLRSPLLYAGTSEWFSVPADTTRKVELPLGLGAPSVGDCALGPGTSCDSVSFSFESDVAVFLPDADLSGSTLTFVEFPYAYISGTVFDDSNLEGLDLKEAVARGASFRGVDLANSWLTESDLAGADLTGANLLEVAMGSTDFTDADLTSATMKDNDYHSVPADAIYDNTTCPDGTNSDDNGGTCADNLEF